MGGSYRQCGECGKRALSIATRCPGCGREFPAPAVPEGRPAVDLGRYLSPRLATGILAAAVILVVAELGRTSGSPGAQSSFVAADAMAASSEVAYAVAAKPAESVGELLVARTWTNVRNARSRRADLEAMLMPGDTVVADSLSKDWYRVALDGEVLGYAHRSTLTVPGTRPGQ